ncbi:hypothetical protein AB0B01_29240 [Streptomyces sp. NPDC044571]|uniref:hypothetical protein n=1 Tax=Streptomyces sp. NPDC044571 TaxID=3155371 RepID=UPI0033F79987
MRVARAAFTCAFVVFAAVAVSGCSEEKGAAAPHLPARSCFGVFTRSDLEPLMGRGEDVKESGPIDMRLTAERRGATCNVYVDGRGRFLASATRQPPEQSFFWHPELIRPAPDPLPLGDKGIVFDTGARVVVTCKSSRDAFQLELALGGSIDSMRAGESRALFSDLMKKFLDAAEQQTRCGA